MLIVEYGFFLGLFGQTPGMCAGPDPVRARHRRRRRSACPRALLRGVLLALVVPALIMDGTGVACTTGPPDIVVAAPYRRRAVLTVDRRITG